MILRSSFWGHHFEVIGFMKLLCESEGHDEGDWEGQSASDATWCARGGKEKETEGPRLALEINSSNPQQPALGKSD